MWTLSKFIEKENKSLDKLKVEIDKIIDKWMLGWI